MKVSIKAAAHMEGFLRPDTREKRIKGALAVIKYREKQGDTFDSIAYRGASGAITASIIAHYLKKPLILVRKPEDNKGHSPYRIEGPATVRRYLIVDDFMSSGVTYDAIREEVRKEHPQAVCIGMLEVTYCGNENPCKDYRLSPNHEDEVEREGRMTAGKATVWDIEWVTRNQPIPPNVKYYPVGIVKEGDTFKFSFEDNRQKLLVADTTEILFSPYVPTFTDEMPKMIDPEVDKVDIFRSKGNIFTPISNFFIDPIKINTYEQKAQTSPEATVSAATEG